MFSQKNASSLDRDHPPKLNLEKTNGVFKIKKTSVVSENTRATLFTNKETSEFSQKPVSFEKSLFGRNPTPEVHVDGKKEDADHNKF